MASFQNSITTFFEVRDGDFAVVMQDDTMLNPSGSPSIPIGATIILRPSTELINGSIAAVIVPDLMTQKPILTIKKIVIDGQNTYMTPLNPRYQSSIFPAEGKIVAIAKGVQYSL